MRHFVRVLLAVSAFVATGAASGNTGPSFDCSKVAEGSIEELICQTPGLSALDRELAAVYGQAAEVAVNEQPPTLKAEQRGWIKGRNECWKSEDKPGCIDSEYRHRIAELQARYRLVAAKGPIFFVCDETPANEVVITYFETEPATLLAEYGDSVSLMFIQPSGSGAKYEGRNETFWEHQGEAMITWGFEAPTMKCKPRNP